MSPDGDPRTVSGQQVPWPAGPLGDQFRFLVEIDRLKTVQRRSTLTDGSRRENSAEHSWHLAMMALVLAEHAAEPVDLPHVVAMLLVHDIVEVDAGDTYVYDVDGNESKDAREQAAADRLYALLPEPGGEQLRALWEEYEAGQTAEARFAASCDRLQPMLLNFFNDGRSWREHDVPASRVRSLNAVIGPGSPDMWAFGRDLIETAVARGWLAEDPRAGDPSDGTDGPAAGTEPPQR